MKKLFRISQNQNETKTADREPMDMINEKPM